MAIKKIKWQELMTNLNADTLFEDSLMTIASIDDMINEKVGTEDQSLYDMTSFIIAEILTDSQNGIWYDMPVYVSTYIEKDKRFIYLLKSKLREYLAFYKKVLTDDGIQRRLVYNKTYENDGQSASNDRNISSVTPQNSNLYDPQNPTSNTLFDQAIADYASSADKNKSDATSHTEGGSDTIVSGTTWDEAKKNIQLMFFNELKDYIYSIPERIYHLYSLETIPAPELTKRFIQHFHEVGKMLRHE